jgi:hypothetical protein
VGRRPRPANSPRTASAWAVTFEHAASSSDQPPIFLPRAHVDTVNVISEIPGGPDRRCCGRQGRRLTRPNPVVLTRYVARRAPEDRRVNIQLVRGQARSLRDEIDPAANDVRVIVVTILRVLDLVLAAAVRLPLEQAQLANETRMIRQPHQAARERRQAFEIDLAARLPAGQILEAGLAPRVGNPLPGVIVAGHAADVVVAAQLGVFLSHLLGIELAGSAAHHIDDDDVALLMPDRDGVGVRTTAGRVDKSKIDDAIPRRQFQRAANVNRTLDVAAINAARAADPAAAGAEWDAEFRTDIGAFLDDELIDRITGGSAIGLSATLSPRLAALLAIWIKVGSDD